MLVVDGTFEEQIDELATFIDSLSQEDSKVQEQIQQCLEQDDKERAIQAVVDSSKVLNDATEKNFEPAHNLLIHILLSADDITVYYPVILTNFKKLPSLSNGPNTSYNILTTFFNVSPPSTRLPVFEALLELSTEHQLYELVSPKFPHVKAWLKEWNASPEEIRSIYGKMAELCSQADAEELHTEYLIRAIETYQENEDSRALTMTAVEAALNEKNRYNVDELLVLPPVRALQNDSPKHHQVLSILSSGAFVDFKSFNADNESFYSESSVVRQTIDHKVRVLNIAALAARQDNRKLRYSDVASALEIGEKEVEAWIIEAIKSGLVEGKLSQPSETFLVHRATYRAFEHEQWEEVSAKLASWRESLQGILEVIDNVKNDISGGQQLANGFTGSEMDGDEARSQHSDLDSIDENRD
ncbi:Eukaryotic translation initiation factor 3 subunit M [Taphrina deformans PYCC 5710]|uniref:Eukaryotic translation initiation factor 3 subunit M n=1 Tax=Taphrina deformans (strain PYCC 5710 / ATCC 11124 / CBS 356.35 / IMI 108563 / JCM 9778 / NBRC 8474) TaxID=1097556 RepID=R4X6N4_TAPDE|nr:Eukaryotic translation initiation factor 3 subunit M [Taphrina deformans PYCC 5710]|eukprot:CCG80851.1 Eukaryotic translation initiation factor 3 subunit M [Taphrina deformans PYCC 5710]